MSVLDVYEHQKGGDDEGHPPRNHLGWNEEPDEGDRDEKRRWQIDVDDERFQGPPQFHLEARDRILKLGVLRYRTISVQILKLNLILKRLFLHTILKQQKLYLSFENISSQTIRTLIFRREEYFSKRSS